MKKGVTKEMFRKWSKEWAESVLNSEEGLKAKEQFDEDFMNYVVYGEISTPTDKVFSLTAREVRERFSDYLSEEQINEFKKYE